MNDFNKNEQMELLERIAAKQPDAISSEQRMSLGIYQDAKAQADPAGLTTDEMLQLRGLKKSIAQDNLSPQQRTSLALKISSLENK